MTSETLTDFGASLPPIAGPSDDLSRLAQATGLRQANFGIKLKFTVSVGIGQIFLCTQTLFSIYTLSSQRSVELGPIKLEIRPLPIITTRKLDLQIRSCASRQSNPTSSRIFINLYCGADSALVTSKFADHGQRSRRLGSLPTNSCHIARSLRIYWQRKPKSPGCRLRRHTRTFARYTDGLCTCPRLEKSASLVFRPSTLVVDND